MRRSVNKGRAKPPGSGGSRKGRPNRITAELKEIILGALDDAGGQRYLAEQAKKSPSAFLTLVGKVLPMTIAGPTGGALDIHVTTRYVKPDA